MPDKNKHWPRFIAFVDMNAFFASIEHLDNLTPADVYYGRGQQIREERELIKLNTMA